MKKISANWKLTNSSGLCSPTTDIKLEKCVDCGEEIYQVIDGFKCPKPCSCRKKEYEQFEKQAELDKKRNRSERVQRLFESSNIGKRFMQRTFETFDASLEPFGYNACKKYAEGFDKHKDNGEGLILIGNYGAGKTHLAGAIAHYLINEKLESVVFITLAGLLMQIKQCYENKELNELEIMKALQSADLVIFDDVGKEKLTEWARERFFEIVNIRYEHMKPIIITTNYDLAILKQHIGDAIFSRLAESNYAIKFKGKDYRIEKSMKEMLGKNKKS